jgi:general nucleoside transport system permease protein
VSATLETEPAAATVAEPRRLPPWLEATLEGVIPVLLSIAASGLLLVVLGRDPFSFYGDILQNGMLTDFGMQQSIVRVATLLLIAGGLIIAFRANVWNLGGDGQWLLSAAIVAGLAPSVVDAIGGGLGLTLMLVLGAVIGGTWTLIPAFLKASYGVNEIITTLMMNFIGINRLPTIGDSQIHIGIVIAVGMMLLIHFTMTRTPVGMRLRVLGANPRAAVHLGVRPKQLTYVAFVGSGAMIGLSGAVSMLGDWGSFRADFNPAYGFLMVPLVFLARLNALATMGFVALFAMIQIGGDTATRKADLPTDFILVLVGLLLFFMAITEYYRRRRQGRLGLAAARPPGDVVDA